ncbi:unnamed protein product [Diplocarpon coronariae]|uniref:AAA ATPase n=1 Tax=Diplocarpon coronariae TaxID=2795749 RepID=A0A218Z3C8_9HELO|nr:AAA ATPase [Marssonina coronariae]
MSSCNRSLEAERDKTCELWYWIECAKSTGFHEGVISIPEARRLADRYLLKNPSISREKARIPVLNTFLHESRLLQRYLVFGVLFPAVYRWSMDAAHDRVQGAIPQDRDQRLRYWRERAIRDPTVPGAFEAVMDPLLDRRFVYGPRAPGEHPSSPGLRVRMAGYLSWKFVLSCEIVYAGLVSRLYVEAYDRDKFHGPYYNACVPYLQMVKDDPLMAPYYIEPAEWPATINMDEDSAIRVSERIHQELP